ncbi:MAG: hypothetical protein ACXW1W_11820 [Methylococcaceae bacterium]
MIRINRKRTLVHFLTTALTVLLLNGCSARVADLTFVSTQNIDLSNTQLDITKGQRHVGEVCNFFLLNAIPFGLPTLEEAVDKALRAGQGNIMVDEVTTFSDVWVIVGNIKCLEVEGTVLNVPPKLYP